MEKKSSCVCRRSMAKIEIVSCFFNLIFSVFVFLSFLNAANGIPEAELDALLSALRAKGYHLFANAVMISDLRVLILDGSYFTIFAPSDGALLDLDSSADAFGYGTALRYHVVPRRFTFEALRALPSGTVLPTLLPGYNVKIEQSVREGWRWETYFLTVDGSSVFFPGIFYGPSVAVHGLDSIFNGTRIWRKDRDHNAESIWPETEIPLTGFGFPPGPPLQPQEESICPGCGFSSNALAPESSPSHSPAAMSVLDKPLGVSQPARQPEPTQEQTTPAQQHEIPLEAINPPSPVLTINQPSQTSSAEERILPTPNPAVNWPRRMFVDETKPPEYGDGFDGYAAVGLDTGSLRPVRNQVTASPAVAAPSVEGNDAGATRTCEMGL